MIEKRTQCHCGTVKFKVALTDRYNTARRCHCSFCRMCGVIATFAPLSETLF
ncbi:hypothetical protein PROSTU_01479 [Providencia stuartii ATCC 25827]|uniref:CENP-V/GFA domain-containing protein n=1 Tax=Providencia stuartii ATCC 25827 TaxID=471874 RepID=A0AA86YV52_PROST|nr:hypothetical protein PROSTU_01479 [Providencia stuartii ATCC 25827]